MENETGDAEPGVYNSLDRHTNCKDLKIDNFSFINALTDVKLTVISVNQIHMRGSDGQ